MNPIIVTAGIILCENKILIAQRKKGKDNELLWELPGGKLEYGETIEQCLAREIKEEFDIDIKVGKFFMETCFEYPKGTVCLKSFFAICNHPHIHEHNSHEQYKWVSVDELKQYMFCPADEPIIEKLQKLDI